MVRRRDYFLYTIRWVCSVGGGPVVGVPQAPLVVFGFLLLGAPQVVGSTGGVFVAPRFVWLLGGVVVTGAPRVVGVVVAPRVVAVVAVGVVVAPRFPLVVFSVACAPRFPSLFLGSWAGWGGS